MRPFTLLISMLFSLSLSAQVNTSKEEGASLTTPPEVPVHKTTGIRCAPSIVDSEPLFIIDGYPARKKDLNEIDPNNIESISVIKDENALLIYGKRASNGVIIIQTKGDFTPIADYTLTSEEIPADLFSLYESLNFGAGKEVIYLLNGKRTKQRKVKKIATSKISAVKVYQSELKVGLMGYSAKEIVVDVILR